MRFAIAFASVTLIVAGCSDPKAASKKNFETAINDWICEYPPCVTLPRGSVRPAEQTADASLFPIYVEQASSDHPLRLENQQRAAKPFEALASAGLLKADTVEIDVDGGYFGGGPRKQVVVAYSLTPEGETAFAETGSAFLGKRPSLCYGEPRVTEIVRYTEPGEMMGVTVSQVEYRYQLRNLPQWTKAQPLREAFPQLARDSAETLESKAAVVLTNEGWVHEKAAKL